MAGNENLIERVLETFDSINIEMLFEKMKFSLKGENKMQGIATYEVASVVLTKGDYEFVSNAKGCSEDTYQLILKDNNEGIIIADEIFTVTDTTEYTVYISINGGAEINTKFSPVIVNVGESTKFIVNNWNFFKK